MNLQIVCVRVCVCHVCACRGHVYGCFNEVGEGGGGSYPLRTSFQKDGCSFDSKVLLKKSTVWTIIIGIVMRALFHILPKHLASNV